MEHSFWEETWQQGKLGFHKDSVNELLINHSDEFLEGGPHTVLVPLCGKSLDLCHLRDLGHRAVGVELVEAAVVAFHDEQGLSPECRPCGDHQSWCSPGIEVLQGDVLRLDPTQTAGVRRVWDRAALVALDAPRRAAYVRLLRSLLPPGSLILLNTFRYDTALMSGPPHSISHAELDRLYEGCHRRLLHQENLLLQEGPRSQALREAGHEAWWSELWLVRL